MTWLCVYFFCTSWVWWAWGWQCDPSCFSDAGNLHLSQPHRRVLLLLLRMRSSLVVRASDCQCTSCNGPGFDPCIRRHSGIWGAADETVLNIVRTNKRKKSPKIIIIIISLLYCTVLYCTVLAVLYLPLWWGAEASSVLLQVDEGKVLT